MPPPIGDETALQPIPAGLGRTPMVPFLIATFIGATIWNTFLLGCGMKLRGHWPVVQKYSHIADYVIVAAILAAGIWFVWKRRARKMGDPR